jgi:hypothetical protein
MLESNTSARPRLKRYGRALCPPFTYRKRKISLVDGAENDARMQRFEINRYA